MKSTNQAMVQIVVGAEIACIEGATKPGLQGIQSAMNTTSLLCWIFVDPKKRLMHSAPTVRPGTAGLPTGTEYSRVGNSTWICPTSLVSTRIGVELVDILENQPNSSD